MSGYRIYRGLLGETIRVPEDTIAPGPYNHDFPRFPFAYLAEKAGEKRDTFALFAMKASLLHEALKHPPTREAMRS